MIDFEALASELEDTTGPTLEEVARERQKDELLTKALAAISEAKAPNVMVNVPPQAAPPVVVQPPIPVSWTFEFERNPDGTIKCIHATPKE